MNGEGLLFGGERRKRSMAARMDFMDVVLYYVPSFFLAEV